uniref:G_PROTEIN_RECEP_F1_2 domain-containing protein n=1 Tax=Steinernema glaseri TaxID=37863 RepID=A0A1I7YTU6_9BILA
MSDITEIPVDRTMPFEMVAFAMFMFLVVNPIMYTLAITVLIPKSRSRIFTIVLSWSLHIFAFFQFAQFTFNWHSGLDFCRANNTTRYVLYF